MSDATEGLSEDDVGGQRDLSGVGDRADARLDSAQDEASARYPDDALMSPDSSRMDSLAQPVVDSLAGTGAMVRLEEHCRRLQESLHEANVLADRMSARSRSLLTEQARERSAAEQEISRLSHQAAEAYRMCSEAQAARAEAESGRAQSEALRVEAELKCSSLQERIEMIHADRDGLLDRFDRARSELESRLRVQEEKHFEAQSALTRISQEFAELKAAHAHSEASRSEAEANCSALDAQLGILREDHEDLRHRFVQATNDLEAAEAQLGTLKQNYDDLLFRSTELEGSLSCETAEKCELQKNLSELHHHHHISVLEFERVKAELQDRLGIKEKLLSNADERIRAFVSASPDWWSRLGQTTGLLKRSNAHRELTEWDSVRDKLLTSGGPTNDAYFLQGNMIQVSGYRSGRDPYQRANSLHELMAWDDLDFVRCAYVTVLGRQPEPAGEAHYARVIRAGGSKFDILQQLRRSAEGQSHDPGIAGFDRALKRAAWQRRPILGALSRLLYSDADGKSRSDRAFRSVMNATAVNQQHLRAIEARLEAVEWGLSSSSEQPSEKSDLSANRMVAKAAPTVVAPHSPELEHLRNRAPLARFFEENAR